MKRLLCLVFALALFVSPMPKKVSAEELSSRYAVAATRDVWFYAFPDESSRLFLLPYTYYVRILREEGEYVAAEYLADDPPFRSVQGYCKKDAVTPVDFTPERPYLFREIEVVYVLPQETTIGEQKFTEARRTFVYYGHRYEGARLYFYVGADGVFDYISATEEISYDLNSDYITSTVAEGEGKSSLSPAGIAAICIACVAAVAVAAFVLRGKRPAPQTEAEHDF